MAIPILLLVSDKDALRWIVIALCSIGVAIRGPNYALMQVAVVSAVLIAVDVTHPTDYGSEGRKVLFTFIGVAIGCSWPSSPTGSRSMPRNPPRTHRRGRVPQPLSQKWAERCAGPIPKG